MLIQLKTDQSSAPIAFAEQHFGLGLNHHLVRRACNPNDVTRRIKKQFGDYLGVAIGRTEFFVRDLWKTKAAGYEPEYKLVGTYLESPTCWAVITGANREDIKDIKSLAGKRIGVHKKGKWAQSRFMSSVLASQQEPLEDGSKPFYSVLVPGTFKERDKDFERLLLSVNRKYRKHSDFFMWEDAASKQYWEDGKLCRLGEINTPWPSHMIAARHEESEALPEIFEKINAAIKFYKENPDIAVEYIMTQTSCSEEIAKVYMESMRFPDDVRGVDPEVVQNTLRILHEAGGYYGADESEYMVGIRR